MIVVSNTTPINYLVLIDEADILRQLYGCVTLPHAVYNEMQREGTPEKVRLWISDYPQWITIKDVDQPDSTLNLGAGERDAITLAQQLEADLILMDDRKGRRAAKERGLDVNGTLAVLAAAAKRELLELPIALSRLQQTTFRASSALIQGLLESHRKS